MCGLDFAASSLDRRAQNAALRSQQQQLNETTRMQGAEFDRRYGLARGSDQRVGDLLTQQFDESGRLNDQTFDYLLGEHRSAFDDQSGVAQRAFDEQMAANSGLMTSTRQARLDQLAASEAERGRQLGFQAQADDLAAAFPSRVGFDAQQGMAGTALAQRDALTNDTVTGPSVPAAATGGGDIVQREFARQSQRGVGEALDRAHVGNRVSATQDGFTGAERNIGIFADAINALTQQAQISRGALPDELAPGALSRSQAGDRYNETVEDSRHHADQLGSMLDQYHGAHIANRNALAENLGRVLDNYFGRSLGSEGDFTQGLIGSSQNYQNTITNLNNFRMQNTTGYSPLANTLRIISGAANSAGRAIAGGM